MYLTDQLPSAARGIRNVAAVSFNTDPLPVTIASPFSVSVAFGAFVNPYPTAVTSEQPSIRPLLGLSEAR